MIKRHFMELKSFGSQCDPEKSEELRRTKTDIEKKLTRVLNHINSEDHSKKDGKTELVRIIDDFYNQYQSLYKRLTGEYMKVAPPKARRVSSVSNSEDTDFNDSNQKPFSKEGFSDFVNDTLQVLKTQTRSNEFEEQLSTQTKELANLKIQNRKLEQQVKQLRGKNTELEGTVSVLHGKLKNNEEQTMSKVSDLMSRLNKLEQEAKLEEKIKRLKQNKISTVMQQNKELENENELEKAMTLIEEENINLELSEKEYSKSITKLEKQVADHEETIRKLTEKIEEKEMKLREKVWKLEAEVSKEGGEKLNKTREVSQLQRKVKKLEKSVEEKDEELVSLGEKKREAIRQLCTLVEFHRDRCLHLKDLLILKKH